MSNWTQDEYNRLCKILASGADEVEFRDRKLKYRSQERLMILKREMEKDLGINQKKRKLFHSFTTNKGL